MKSKKNIKLINYGPQNTFRNIEKRGGTKVPFDEEKISDSISNALEISCLDDKKLAKKLGSKVVNKLLENGIYNSKITTTEDVQDIVQLVLMENNHSDVASGYITHRLERRKFRNSIILKEPILTTNHKKILKFFMELLSIPSGTFVSFKPLKKRVL